MARLGLYIHYPYCRRRCDYCDFAITVPAPAASKSRSYRDAVIAELGARLAAFGPSELVSIYFGGGTPSLWPASDIAAVVSAALAKFGPGEREVTLEANPIDCTPTALASWLEAGINRLSIGVQATSNSELAVLGRDHGMGDGPTAIRAALDAGFERLSADVIIGTPGGDDPLASLAEIAEHELGHLSVYELTFESGAPLGRAAARGEITPRPDDELADLYERAHHLLVDRGYEHYEISSYAKAGARAVHNSLYWQGADYLGIGSSSASHRRLSEGGAVRETNVRSAARYLNAKSTETVAEHEALTASEARAEYLWLSLRTSDGAFSHELDDRPGLREWLLSLELVTLEGDRIRPTLKGFLYADQIAARVVRYP